MNTFTDESFIVTKSLRDQYIDRIDVLNKVKALFLIPKVNLMNTNMVASFFDVPAETIRSLYKNNREELDSDGAKNLKLREIFDRSMIDHSNSIAKSRGGVVIKLEDGQQFQLTNGAAAYFPPRAIMRMAMLLRDSSIAKEVRQRLLSALLDNSEEYEILSRDQACLMSFSNPEFGTVRTILINGEPWLVGKEVAEALGYKDYAHAILDPVEEEDRLNSKTQGQFDREFGQRDARLINESGFLALSSTGYRRIYRMANILQTLAFPHRAYVFQEFDHCYPCVNLCRDFRKSICRTR